jgi:hypothetical protein
MNVRMNQYEYSIGEEGGEGGNGDKVSQVTIILMHR